MLQTFADVIRIATFQSPSQSQGSESRDRKEEMRRLRRELPQLSAHLLRDIGLDPNDIDEEERPPIWRWSPR